jgi:hypothetical protein
MEIDNRHIILSLIIAFVISARQSTGSSRETAGQDQPPKSSINAFAVVCENDVQNAKDSLGPPDDRSAEILPGGQLVLLLEDKLYPFVAGKEGGLAVSGQIIGKDGEDVRLEGLFAWLDRQGKKHLAWVPMGIWDGLSIFPPLLESFDSKAGMEMIKIANVGAESIFVDAVVGQSHPLMN